MSAGLDEALRTTGLRLIEAEEHLADARRYSSGPVIDQVLELAEHQLSATREVLRITLVLAVVLPRRNP